VDKIRFETGVIDKNGKMICLGDTLRTYDRTGKAWVGEVVRVDQTKVIEGPNPCFALQTNYETWLHPEHGHFYEVIDAVQE
jgi:hypothetical protein